MCSRQVSEPPRDWCWQEKRSTRGWWARI